MTSVSIRMKQLRQRLRYSLTIRQIYEDYKNGLLTKKEIIDSINMILDDKNPPELRYKMINNQEMRGRMK